MRFGKERDYEDRMSQLVTMLDWENGAIFDSSVGVPKAAVDFVDQQFARFGIPMPQKLWPLKALGPALAIHLVDYSDPYMLFWEYSDVCCNPEWCQNTYEISTSRGKKFEADPTDLETFHVDFNQGNEFFNKHIAMPGVKAFPEHLSSSVDEGMELFLSDQYWPAVLNLVQGYPDLKQLKHDVMMECIERGDMNHKKFKAYFDLSMWAGILWLFGPYSREWRRENSEIYHAAFNYAEFILYEQQIYIPSEYVKIPRSPNSCYKCGIDAWCVENTLDHSGTARSICEGCMTKGMPRIATTTCGTKFCKYYECHHNAWHQHGAGGLKDMMRQHGQLTSKMRDQQELIMQQSQQLLGT